MRFCEALITLPHLEALRAAAEGSSFIYHQARYQTVFCEEAEGRRKPRNERAFGQHGVIIGSLARHLPFAAQNSRGHLAARPDTDSAEDVRC